MLLALAPLVFLLLAPPARRDPPIKIKLSDDVYIRGERARVKVKTTDNGYLLVLRADAQHCAARRWAPDGAGGGGEVGAGAIRGLVAYVVGAGGDWRGLEST